MLTAFEPSSITFDHRCPECRKHSVVWIIDTTWKLLGKEKVLVKFCAKCMYHWTDLSRFKHSQVSEYTKYYKKLKKDICRIKTVQDFLKQ